MPQTIEDIFELQGLQVFNPADKPEYVRAGKKLAEELEKIKDSERLFAAVKNFNKLFNNIALSEPAVSFSEEGTLRGQGELIFSEIKKFLLKENITSYKNYLVLLVHCYFTTTENYQQHALVYHQFGHAAEMFFDHRKLLEQAASLKDFRVLMSLCGLFHDIIFTKARIHDEENSAKELIKLLGRILRKLDPVEAEIIEAFIYVIIVGGTVPCFLKNNAVGVPEPVMRSLFETLQDVLPSTNPALCNLLTTIGHLDVRRSAVKPLWIPVPNQEPQSWNVINPIFFSDRASTIVAVMQRKIAQSWRVWAEVNSTHPIALAILNCQRGLQFIIPDSFDYAAFAHDFLSPVSMMVSFEDRMENYLKSNTSLTSFSLENFSRETKMFWQNLHDFFAGEQPVCEKRRVMQAMVAAAVIQDGLNVSLFADNLQRLADECYGEAQLASASVLKRVGRFTVGTAQQASTSHDEQATEADPLNELQRNHFRKINSRSR